MNQFERLTAITLLVLAVALLILVGFSATAWLGWLA